MDKHCGLIGHLQEKQPTICQSFRTLSVRCGLFWIQSDQKRCDVNLQQLPLKRTDLFFWLLLTQTQTGCASNSHSS
ncbi:uncharacterized protein V6R79_019310 [Siganus canaliculatus]